MRRAFATYTCDDAYVPGVVALINSLRHHGNTSDIVVCITDDVTPGKKQEIEKLGAMCFVVQPVEYNGTQKCYLRAPVWKYLTKFGIWTLTHYDKVVYIDADAIVRTNIESMFELPSVSAVLGESKQIGYQGVETGVMVITPSRNTYDALVGAAQSDTHDMRMADQSVINDFFYKHRKSHYMDDKYNRLWKKQELAGAWIYHFNANKPWNDATLRNADIWRQYYSLRCSVN